LRKNNLNNVYFFQQKKESLSVVILFYYIAIISLYLFIFKSVIFSLLNYNLSLFLNGWNIFFIYFNDTNLQILFIRYIVTLIETIELEI
jgi:hypothetical protein